MKITKRLIARLGIAAAASIVLTAPTAAYAPQAQSDAQVRQAIIRQSIASYSGNCPCPYNRASNGSRCGGRSAYSRGGGAAPMCYASDVSDAQVAAYRRRNR
ncbi:MAG: hypothetical protein Q7J13_14990 [Brevundimonas sp.]|uniref:hypothetical protein n=1 Tax=Brevundimonas sp. TaxID=1871086 RepID=UPI00272864A2|nr:hypothetical protein [Brevundimonas sp.]MDO9589219.1 hypothetical protein [Brevundimonas sp.]